MPTPAHSPFSAARLLRRKLPETGGKGAALQKALGTWDLALLGIGAILGAWAFVLTGVVAAMQAGPAIVLSFVVAGFACAFAALAYAELAASVGGSGSAYNYAYAAFGEFAAWLTGWTLMLAYGVSVAAVASGWSVYVYAGLASLGFVIPEALISAPFPAASYEIEGMTVEKTAPGAVNLPAAGIILFLMGLLASGVKQGARFSAAAAVLAALAIFVLIGAAAPHVQPDLWSPLMPWGWLERLEDGRAAGVLAAVSTVFFAYAGFDAVSAAAEEARDPRRDVPVGILSSLAFCTVIYILVSGLLTGVQSYRDIDLTQPVVHVLEKLGFDWGPALVFAGVIAGLTTAMTALFYGLTRVVFAMARDGLLPRALAAVSGTTRTPARATFACGVVLAIAAGFLPLGRLAELVNAGTLAVFAVVCAAAIALRLRDPRMKRPFKMPGGAMMPLLGLLACGALMLSLPASAHVRFCGWLLAGAAVYFAHGLRHHFVHGLRHKRINTAPAKPSRARSVKKGK